MEEQREISRPGALQSRAPALLPGLPLFVWILLECKAEKCAQPQGKLSPMLVMQNEENSTSKPMLGAGWC